MNISNKASIRILLKLSAIFVSLTFPLMSLCQTFEEPGNIFSFFGVTIFCIIICSFVCEDLLRKPLYPQTMDFMGVTLEHTREYKQRLVINEILKAILSCEMGILLGMIFGLIATFPAMLCRIIINGPIKIWSLL